MPLGQDRLVEELHRILEGESGVRLALLFGSHARGTAAHDSDVDVAVDARGVDLLRLAARLSEHLGAEVDVVPLEAASIPLLERLIDEGIVIHEKDAGAGAAWRSKVLAALETDRPWYRRMRDAWLARVARDGLGDGR